jgi:hypothetical protein
MSKLGRPLKSFDASKAKKNGITLAWSLIRNEKNNDSLWETLPCDWEVRGIADPPPPKKKKNALHGMKSYYDLCPVGNWTHVSRFWNSSINYELIKYFDTYVCISIFK